MKSLMAIAATLSTAKEEAPDLRLAEYTWDETTRPLSLDVIAALIEQEDPTLAIRLDLPDELPGSPEPAASDESKR